MSNVSDRPLRAEDRTCGGCGWQLQATRARAWVLKGVVPLGSTAIYKCAICGNRFRVRTPWHLTVLAGVALFIARVLIDRPFSAQEALIMLPVGGHCLFAIVEDRRDRKKNPRWDGPDSVDRGYAVPVPARTGPAPAAQATPPQRKVTPLRARLNVVGLIAAGAAIAQVMVLVLPWVPYQGTIAALLRLPVLLASVLVVLGGFVVLCGKPLSSCAELWLTFPGWLNLVTVLLSTAAWLAMIIAIVAAERRIAGARHLDPRPESTAVAQTQGRGRLR